MITDDAALAELCRRVADAGWFAFDTEFVGEDQHRPEVCLIQVAVDGCCALIDPLAGLETGPIWERIADAGLMVIVHSGGEDIAQCLARTGTPPRNIFDIQIAAGMIGLGYPASLARLAKVTLGRKIHKAHTLSDWRRRPLLEEQIQYAAEDVLYLRPIYDFIYARLVSLGREAWVREECEAMCRLACEGQTRGPTLKRLKGAGSLKRRELAVAHALLEEREKLAAEYNRPARALLKDHLLVEIARRGWTDVKRIQSLRGMQLKASAAKRLAAVVREAGKLPPEAWPDLPSSEDSSEEEVVLSLLSAVLRDYCNRNELAYSLLCKKQHLRALLRRRTRPDAPALGHVFENGWRKEAVGDLLEGLISGSRAVRVRAEGRNLGLSLE